jgi:ABC-type branched-subunit amino acid transport system ATPase component
MKEIVMMELVRQLFEAEGTLFNGAGTPLKAHLTEGDQHSKVLVVTGSNASGKSFAVKALAAWLNHEQPKIEALQVSMKYRTMPGMHRCFMFGALGDEMDSTGSISTGAVNAAISTARGRDTPCCVMLDEPDTGLSEDFCPAMGEYIAQAVNEGLGEKCQGLVVVTHSKALVRAMVEALGTPPHFAHMDEEPQTLEGWLSSSRRRTIEELVGLPQKSILTYRALNKVLKD